MTTETQRHRKNRRRIHILCAPLLLWSGFLLPISPAFAESPQIEIIYPKKGQTVRATKKTFILGHVTPVNAALSINGEKVDVYRSGGFLAVLPVTQGDFSFHCVASLPDGSSVTRTLPVQIPIPRVPKTTELPLFEPGSSLPAQNLGLLPGEEVLFQCKTLPGKQVECAVGQTLFRFPLLEQPANSGVRGIYRARFAFPTKMEKASITFSVPKEQGIPSMTLPVTLTVLPENEHPVAEITEERAKARLEPDGGYDTFLKKGSLLQSSGFQGSWLRLLLSQNHPVYVQKNQAILHPPSQEISWATLKSVSCGEDERFLILRLPHMKPVNLTWVEHLGEKILEARFYRTKNNIDRVLEDSESPSLKDLSWLQIDPDVLQLKIFPSFAPEWGYGIDFEKGGASIRIKKPLTGRPPSQIKICLDAGHGPDTGAIGPTGKTEESCTLAQVLVVREELQRRGFTVVSTREKREGPPLETRPLIAMEQDTDLFLSLHYNASGDGADPYEDRGLESYYYNRAGKKLGRKIHARVAAVTQIKNKKLRFGNLAVCRNERVPALLLEIDYLIVPSAEERIQDEDFRRKIAGAIADGIGDYLKE